MKPFHFVSSGCIVRTTFIKNRAQDEKIYKENILLFIKNTVFYIKKDFMLQQREQSRECLGELHHLLVEKCYCSFTAKRQRDKAAETSSSGLFALNVSMKINIPAF